MIAWLSQLGGFASSNLFNLFWQIRITSFATIMSSDLWFKFLDECDAHNVT